MSRAIAAIFAHPDDEVFSIGGTIARYAAENVRCDLYCATDGDAGRASGVAVRSREELAARRRAELEEGARILGFASVRSAGFADGALASADPDVVVGQIVEHIRRWKPAIVITFGPEGGPNTHRDHRAISRLATAAFHAAAIPTMYPDVGAPYTPARLYYLAWPAPSPGAALPAMSLAITARVDIRDTREVKRRSFLVHATQQDHLGRFDELALTETEGYHLAAGRAQPRAVIEDLFEGL